MAGRSAKPRSTPPSFPTCRKDTMPCDLLYEEFHIRRQAGEDVEIEEYQRRFPAQAANSPD